MRKGLGRAVGVLCAVAAVGVVALAGSIVAGATPSLPATGNGIVPTTQDGSSIFAECSTALTREDHIFGLKVEKNSLTSFNGTYDKTNTSHTHGNDNPLRVTIANTQVSGGVASFGWSANMPVDFVYVKAGTKATVYDYRSYGWGGMPATGPWGDTGLVSPKDSISHVLFCTIKKLRVQKTAAASFTRQYQWTIAKQVKTDGGFAETAALSLSGGDSGSAEWRISVGQTGSVDTNPNVAGTITVLDSSPYDVSGVLDESLPNVTFSGSCSPKSGSSDKATFAVAKGQAITCAYSAPLERKADGTNSVEADPVTPNWMTSTSASAPYAFGAPTSEIDKTVRWQDSNGESKSGITAGDTATYQTTNDCGVSHEVTNNAQLFGDAQRELGSDTATLEITCVPAQKLHVSKTVDATSFERTWTWTIDKQVKTTGQYADSASLALDQGGSGVAHYKVTVHGSSVDGRFAVSGAITVTNPNAHAVSGVSVTDVLPGAAVDCGGGASSGLTIAGNGSLTCRYTAISEGAKPTSNTASVTVSGKSQYDSTSEPVAIVFGAPTVVNGAVDVTDAFDGGPAAPVAGGLDLTPASLDANGDTVLTYDRTLRCGSTGTHPNTAYVTKASSTSEPFDEDSASVAVACNPPKALTVSKTAVPSFTRTYDWTVTKTADPSSIALQDGGTGSSTWTVTLVRGAEPVDSAWRVGGTITVGNPNAFPVGGVTVGDSLGGTVACPSTTIAASSSITCTYSVALESGASGTNTATASTTTPGVGSGQGSARYAFDEPTRVVNDNVDVVDTNGKTWSDRTEGFTESYSTGTLPCSDATYSNTVRVIGDGGAILSTSTASVAVTCSTTPPPPAPPSPPPPPAAHVVDVGVTKSATTPTKLHGNVTYTIVVSSLGPDAANGIELGDPAPGGVAYVSASSTDPSVTCSVEQSGALVSCSRPGLLAAGQSFVVTVVGKAKQTGTLTNTVTVTTPGDTKASNNQASASTLVVAPVTPPTAKPKPKKRAICSILRVAPKAITVGKAGTLKLTVRAAGKPVSGVLIRIKGPGVNKVVRVGRKGIAIVSIRAAKSGIVVISIAGKKGCNTARVGVVGAFEPPLTG